MDKLRILIIEDDADQRELIREQVEDRFGAGTVVGVESMTSALAQDLRSFDLILTDYNLPDGTGMEVLQAVRERCNTPVIMVTGENVGHIAAEAIQRGAMDYVVKFGDYLFTIPLVIEKNLTVAKIIREKEDLRRQLEEKNRELAQMAATDPLTGLYNRRHFGRVLEQMFAEAKQFESDMACVMIDLDEYKQFNDAHGHQLGDELLMVVGRVISRNMRRMDVAARYGGDEFVLLLPHASVEEASAAAQRIAEEFSSASRRMVPGGSHGVTMSIGVASMHRNKPLHVDQLIGQADGALYDAKQAGKRCVSIAPPSSLAA